MKSTWPQSTATFYSIRWPDNLFKQDDLFESSKVCISVSFPDCPKKGVFRCFESTATKKDIFIQFDWTKTARAWNVSRLTFQESTLLRMPEHKLYRKPCYDSTIAIYEGCPANGLRLKILFGPLKAISSRTLRRVT